jgi:putative flippase GtrA
LHRLPDKLLVEMLKFGVVGGTAIFVHLGVFSGLIEFSTVRPMLANLLGFVLSLLVSFCGHNWWTFKRGTEGRPSVSIIGSRYLVVVLSGFAVSSLIVFVSIEILQTRYAFTVFLIFAIVPLAQFIMGRLWTFRNQPG